MKALFKRTAALVLTLSSVALATELVTTEVLNRKIAAITAPYNDPNTKLQIQVTDLKMDDQRVRDFGLAAQLIQRGNANNLELNIPNLSYHYGNGTQPVINADVALKLDLIKALGRDMLNFYANDFQKVIADMTEEYAKNYGKAATLTAQLVDLQKDPQGNMKSARILIHAELDLAKLPPEMKPEDLEVKSLDAQLDLREGGLNLRLSILPNPGYRGFAKGQPGLKELLADFVSEDSETSAQLSDFIKLIHFLSDAIVNAPPPTP